jgi:hypothetical protein
MEFKELEGYIKKATNDESLSFYDTAKQHWETKIFPMLAYQKEGKIRDKIFQVADEINRIIIVIDTQRKFIHFQKDNILRMAGLVACCDIFCDIIESELLELE